MKRFGTTLVLPLAVSLLALAILTNRSVVAASSLRRVRHEPPKVSSPSIYDCLQAASGSEECHSSFDGGCVWCAEPIYGLCVTPDVASKIGNLPFFTCDSNITTNIQEHPKEKISAHLQELE